MVHSRTHRLDETFFALSDPTRRAIVTRLARGEATVAEVSRPFEISAPAISKHLRVLERAGIVKQRREGRERRCRLVRRPLVEAESYFDRQRRFWEDRLDELATYVEGEAGVEGRERSKRSRS